jgi:hypothetical protein
MIAVTQFSDSDRGIGCMDVVEALLPCLKMKPKYFCQFSISLRTYIAYNENIASFNVLHKIVIRIYKLF